MSEEDPNKFGEGRPPVDADALLADVLKEQAETKKAEESDLIMIHETEIRILTVLLANGHDTTELKERLQNSSGATTLDDIAHSISDELDKREEAGEDSSSQDMKDLTRHEVHARSIHFVGEGVGRAIQDFEAAPKLRIQRDMRKIAIPEEWKRDLMWWVDGLLPGKSIFEVSDEELRILDQEDAKNEHLLGQYIVLVDRIEAILSEELGSDELPGLAHAIAAMTIVLREEGVDVDEYTTRLETAAARANTTINSPIVTRALKEGTDLLESTEEDE